MPSERAAAAEGERRLHPLTFLFAAAGVARQMVIPAVVGGFGIGDGEWERVVPWIVGLLGVPALLAAAAKYWFFVFRVGADELVIRSGVLSRKHRVIPLARVQNVEVRQSALQRLFGVAELRVETAGAGGDTEAVLSVLRRDEAQALRTAVLAQRARATAAESGSVESIGSAESMDSIGSVGSIGSSGLAEEGVPVRLPAAAPVVPMVRLTTSDLLLAGATANEAGVIAAAAVGALQLVDELNVPILQRLDPAEWIGRAAGAAHVGFVLAGAALLLLVLVLGWLVSMAGAVVRYHGFTLAKEGGELRKRYGLLTLREGSVPLERVQAVRIEESLLRRPFGLAALMIETAGARPGEAEAAGGAGAEAFVPIAHRGEVVRLVRGVFGDFDFDRLGLQPVHPRSRARAVRRYALLLGIPALAFALVAWRAGQPAWILALLPAVPLPRLLAGWQYVNRGWALQQGYVVARAGVLNRVTWIIPEHKLQTLHLRESPFQRRAGLASLVVDTAAGGRQAVVADLGAERARALLTDLAARVRSASRAKARMRVRAI